jgi:hypothetical protein
MVQEHIARNEAGRSSQRRINSAGSEKELASNLAQITKIALETNAASDTQTLDTLQRTLDTLGRGQSRLSRLFEGGPVNVDYRIQRARVLDKEALIALDRNPAEAYELSTQALHSLDGAIQGVPENGGLHEQRAILLLHLVAIMKKQAKGSQQIRAKESEEAKEYIRALALQPKENSALWGAVYAQINLGNDEDVIDLARAITLLQPGSRAASAAYIVALESGIKTPWKEPEKEKEVVGRLKRFLESSPDASQLLAIWDALIMKNDRDGLDLIATGAKRLFPENSIFEERKLRSYSAGLLNSVDLLNYDALIEG